MVAMVANFINVLKTVELYFYVYLNYIWIKIKDFNEKGNEELMYAPMQMKHHKWTKPDTKATS